MRRTTTTAVAAVILVPLVVAAGGSPALAADSGDVTVSNTETVQARLSATGSFQGARVYEQLALTGHGTATIANPVSTEGLRNLDGFGGYKVVDGKLVSTLSVDGERRERSLSDYDKDLPLTVEVTYTFDGETVQPGAVVGKAGTLGVHYKVTNVTGKTQDVTYDDGTGTMATASAETVIPMIGQLVTVLPSTFTDVQSDEAGMAGDGRGGTRMQFQMTLFPPIGSATAEFGYTAEVSHAVIPKATLTSMPVSPLEYPSFKGGAASYQAGAQKGVDLTAGATKIDESVLQLHDGAAQLLAGLLQLRDGAATLSDGLNDSAAPGAAQLAAGLNDKAAPGAEKLAAGLNDKLAPGAQQLAAGLTKDAAPGAAALALGASQLDTGLADAVKKAPALITGLTDVDAGLTTVEAGLTTMYGGLTDMSNSAPALTTGIATLKARIGSITTTGTLLGTLEQLRVGAATAAAGSTQLSLNATGLGTSLDASVTELDKLKASVDPDPAAQLAYATELATLSAKIDKLAEISAGNATLADNLGVVAGGLAQVECGVSGARAGCPKDSSGNVVPGVLEGVGSIEAGVGLLLGGINQVRAGMGDADDTKADLTARGGIHSLQAGVKELRAGGGALGSGLGQLSAGATRLNAGAGSLSTGLTTAATGSAALAAGLQDAAAGSTTLSDGIETAAEGSDELADGIEAAADGSTQLSEGLVTASEGAPKLVDGTQQLSDEGTSQVVVSGQGTAEDFGVKYAVLSAGAERAQTEGMAYGAPEGATGATAYSIEIAGVDGTGASSVGRLILAIVLFAGGIGLATLARRRFV
ncbi:hypothetical protein [Cellulomonas sp. Leaf334]|uniref:hypothetical protein n=1 Tax=Cellulomonas sp. Leaf334 TaxID=1736339 RepID=UPI0006F2F696|nr:hypothetical protein [Cellulomonas sp. Leaf334]KQR16737.1 hypothetical protein ASF78_05125 [Cellulomonas sp. Leaf334]